MKSPVWEECLKDKIRRRRSWWWSLLQRRSKLGNINNHNSYEKMSPHEDSSTGSVCLKGNPFYIADQSVDSCKGHNKAQLPRVTCNPFLPNVSSDLKAYAWRFIQEIERGADSCEGSYTCVSLTLSQSTHYYGRWVWRWPFLFTVVLAKARWFHQANGKR